MSVIMMFQNSLGMYAGLVMVCSSGSSQDPGNHRDNAGRFLLFQATLCSEAEKEQYAQSQDY